MGVYRRRTLRRIGLTNTNEPIAASVAPSNAIFLDDYEGNITAAEKLGIHGILVGYDPTEAIGVLDAVIESTVGS